MRITAIIIHSTTSNNNNNNNKQLCAFDITLFVLCTPCFAPSFVSTRSVYSARSSWLLLLASPALPNTVLCLLLLVLLLLLAVVPVDLFFLNTILISAMLPILYHESSAHTHFLLPFLLLPSSRLLCRTHCSLPLLYLFLIRLLQRAPRTPSKLVNPSIGSSCTIRLEPLLLYSSRILNTYHGTHCIHAPRCSPYSFFQRTVRHLYTCHSARR